MTEVKEPNNVEKICVISLLFGEREGKESFVRKIQKSKNLIEKVKVKISFCIGCFLSKSGVGDNEIDNYLNEHSVFIEATVENILREVICVEDDKLFVGCKQKGAENENV